MAVTYKELSLVAELHYSRLPDAFKLKAGEFFDSLDLDGDGSVTLPELLNSNLEGKFGQEFIQDVFYSLDMEGKGHLNFRESLTLYYLCMYSGRLCEGDGCERHIPHGLGYTCFKCWKEGVSSVDGQAFCLCLDCYSSLNYQHQHDPLHLLHDFVLFDNLLNNKPTSPTAPTLAPIRAIEQTVKQCIVCGDYHESGAKGFTCDVHMAKMRDSTEFVCEWCFSYLCSKCGNLYRDSTTRAEPGKWLQKFVCPSCHQKKITTECYDASVRRLQRVLGGTELLRHCRTCEIKHKNGTLFWIVNGTNLAASSSATSATAQQSRASATINARSRNPSFDNQPQVNPATSGSGYVGGGVGNGISSRGGRGSGGISSRGGRGNPMNVQEGNGNGSSRGRGFASRGGGGGRGRGTSQMYDEGNMALGGGGFINRSSFQEDGADDLSRSSSGSSSTGGPISFNKANLQETAARTVNRMMNVANRAANMFNAGAGGGGGGGAGAEAEAGAEAGSGGGGGEEDGGSGVFGGIFGNGDGGSGEGMFASISTLVNGIVTEEEYAS